MKASKYTRFFTSESDNKPLLFNGMTGAFAVLENEHKYSLVKKILSNPEQVDQEDEVISDLWSKLVRGGFLIDDSVNELALLKIRNRVGRFNSTGFGLTILPTLDCNFRCTYCYQEQKKVHMSRQVEDAIVKLVQERLKPKEPLNISWFGGEPLVRLKQITRMTKKFIEICEERESSYSANMVSNGYLLSENATKKLQEARVSSVQITLDGAAKTHDKKRFLRDGSGTFERIITNIERTVNRYKAEDKLPFWISIRINVDKENWREVPLLLTELEQRGLKNKVGVYVAQIQEYTDVCASIGGKCFSDQEYTKIEVELYREFLARGFQISKYPTIRSGYCTADSPNSLVIGPDGSLYGCWSEVGTASKTGHLLNDQNGSTFYPQLVEYLSWDPFEKTDCVECEVLPICMGGCPYQALRANLENRGSCEDWKNNLTEMLQLYYTSRQDRFVSSPAMSN